MWHKIGLLALSLILTLLAFEASLRVAARLADRQPRLHDPALAAPANQPRALFHKIQLSRDPNIVYELRPNFSGEGYLGEKVTINAAGFRGLFYPKKKPPRTVRIVGLGDSVMYGQGVSDDEVYLVHLSRQLNAQYPDVTWEIVNTAVPGYNTTMEVETLRVKGLDYDPDLVIIHYIGNDIMLPNFLTERVSMFSLTHSHLINFILERIRGAPYLEIVDAPLNAAGNAFEDDPDKAPEQYRHMVGVGAYRKTMHELRRLRDKHGFQLIALTGGPGPDYFLQTCRDEGIPVVTGWDAFLAHMKEHGSGSFVESDIVLSKTDIHPSPIGHRLHAGSFILAMTAKGGTTVK